MRVLIAPDCFGGTLTAVAAAEAIAAGWRAVTDDNVVLRPLADGGPGLVDVLHAGVGGTLMVTEVTGPLGTPTEARWLAHGDVGYIESAQACGLHLMPTPPTPEDATTATSRGVGELLVAVRDAGMRTAVVGLGGTGCTDGGAGLLAALGVAAIDAHGAPVGVGGAGLAHVADLVGAPQLDGLRLVIAADVTNPLLGTHGAARVFGPQKGADAPTVDVLESAMARWADVLARWPGGVGDVRTLDAAGAAGGLGAALLALGAERRSGADLVAERTGLDAAIDKADLVVTGEGSFDWQSLRGKLVTRVADGAARRGLPCLVVAGQVQVGRREAAAAGVDATYAAADEAGSVAAALADPSGTLTAVARRAAADWGTRRR